MAINSFQWTCRFCGHDVTIGREDHSYSQHEFNHGNKHKFQLLATTATVCPNPACREYALTATLYMRRGPSGNWGGARHSWDLIPAAHMKMFPDYIPPAVVVDYQEACLIRKHSPRASATLSRRCLQGMIRDFWGIKKRRLVDEVNAIEDNVDPLTWKAIDAVRNIGNVGAHMEADINVIIEVDPDEASLLINLIETLVHDWYVTRHERQARLEKIVAASAKKSAAKKAGRRKPPSPDENPSPE